MKKQWMTCILVCLGFLLPQTAFATNVSSVGFRVKPYKESMQHCRKITQESLRKELLKISQGAFEKNQVEFQKLVDKQWSAMKLDDVLDKVVKQAAKKVHDETGYFGRIQSSFSKTKAKVMAEKMARYAFQSPAFKGAMKKLSHNIAGQLNDVIHEKAKLSINRSIECINQFLKSKYNDVIKEIFRSQLASSFSRQAGSQDKLYALPSIVAQRSKGLLGVGIIVTHQIVRLVARRIARRIASRIARSIGMKIATRIGTKLIPWVGWGLLVWDVWDIAKAKGSIPTIAKSLKSERVRTRIKGELTKSIKESFESNYRTIVRQVSDSIYGVWIGFQKKFRNVLMLADKNESFRHSLKSIKKTKQLFYVVRLYSLLGEKGMVTLAKSGRLIELVENPFRDELVALLRYKPDINFALGWYQLAGMRLKKVVQFEMYKHKQPDELPRKTLDVLLSLSSPADVSKLLLLSNPEIDQFGRMSKVNRRRLIKNLSPSQLMLTSRYMKDIKGEKRNQLLRALMIPPSKALSILEKPEVSALIQGQADKLSLIRFFLATRSFQDLQSIRDLPTQAYFLKYGRVAYYFILALLIFLLPLLIIIGTWSFRLSFGAYRIFFKALFPGGRKKPNA